LKESLYYDYRFTHRNIAKNKIKKIKTNIQKVLFGSSLSKHCPLISSNFVLSGLFSTQLQPKCDELTKYLKIEFSLKEVQ
jgi:hypothetical protein